MFRFSFVVLLAQPLLVTGGHINAVLLAGQSNMAGRGGVIGGKWNSVVPTECHQNPDVIRLNAGLEWQEPMEPIHKDIDTKRECGIGPGMPFAKSLLDMKPSFAVIGLVPCAIGGTTISNWTQGSELYDQLIRRANSSVQTGAVIRGMLWYQGEIDAESREDAELYKTRLENFFKYVRCDLQSPMLPIVQVALACGNPPYTDLVREAQLSIQLPNLTTVDAKDLPLGEDHLHLTTEGQVQLGKMLADAFIKMVPVLNNKHG